MAPLGVSVIIKALYLFFAAILAQRLVVHNYLLAGIYIFTAAAIVFIISMNNLSFSVLMPRK